MSTHFNVKISIFNKKTLLRPKLLRKNSLSKQLFLSQNQQFLPLRRHSSNIAARASVGISIQKFCAVGQRKYHIPLGIEFELFNMHHLIGYNVYPLTFPVRSALLCKVSEREHLAEHLRIHCKSDGGRIRRVEQLDERVSYRRNIRTRRRYNTDTSEA